MASAADGRIAALDLIRGIAVLGILTINIAGFAATPHTTFDPHLPVAAGPVDEIAFAANFTLFQGKMRGLFTLLFGAGLILFVERKDAGGGHGEAMQMRRLAWLALFGLLHFFFLWWGDILFLYACAGVIALFMAELQNRTLVIAALAIFAGWHGGATALSLPGVLAEQRVIAGTASYSERTEHAELHRRFHADSARSLAVFRKGYGEQVRNKFTEHPTQPLETLLSTIGETLPLMLLGIVLMRTGFFAGQWDRHRMRRIALWGIAAGGMASLALIAWPWSQQFPPEAMNMIVLYLGGFPQLAMTLGYAALLMLLAPRLLESAPGRWLAAAGKMAFSNYIATSLVMAAIFYGWGLGLVGTYPIAAQWLFVLPAWAAMLAFSTLWLRHFRRGPLEWLWRSLVERRLLANRR